MVSSLESIPQLHDERVHAHAAHHVSFGNGILLQVLLLDLLLTKHFHGQKHLVLLALDEEHLTEATCSKELVRNELFRAVSGLSGYDQLVRCFEQCPRGAAHMSISKKPSFLINFLLEVQC